VILDELVVVLGLDASKFTEEQRRALDGFRRTQFEVEKAGTAVEAQGMKMSEVFGIARKGVLGLLGAFIGGEAAAFVGHVISMDAATGRMAKTIGTSVANLSTWQYMIQQVGGEADSATSALSSLQQEIENVRQGGGMFEGGFASLMNQAGVSIQDDADASLRKIQAFISGQIAAGKMRPEEAATFLRRVPGMNQDMINLMLADFRKIEEEARKAGTATKETADAAAGLTAKFSLLKQAMERAAAGLIPLIDVLMKPIKDITREDVGKFGVNDLFERDSPMDRLDRWLWGDHNMADAKKRLAEGLRAGQRSSAEATPGPTPPGPPAAPVPGRPGQSPGPGEVSSRGDRNNNPGNIEYGAFARAHGATGRDGRFAVFPDYETGARAQAALVGSTSYQGLTLDQFARKYAEGDKAWERTVGKELGIRPGDVVDNRDPRLLAAIRRAEGTGGGGARASAASRAGAVDNSRTSTSTSEVHIGKIEVNAPNATDADGVAGGIGDAMKRQSLIAPVNYGLV
jgi:hypothetical protein